ncbi:MAG TPA: 16S rRNA methyltransferase [Opitutae bacterium]|nr:16S rRNA methyltransferase [Opitutae bacterium]
MNIILFDEPFESATLPAGSEEAKHIRKVLRAQVGTKVFIGFVNGLRARAVVKSLSDAGDVELEVIGTEAAPKPLPISLLIGLPRPHTAKRLLFDAASMGVRALHFFESERSEPSYAQSSLWSTNEWRERVRLGVEQSFGTYHPEVAMHSDLQSAISALFGAGINIALDNYESAGALGEVLPESATSAVIALGSERGWAPNERDVFRKNGWKLAHLGPHVLRSETAAVAAVAATAARLGLCKEQTVTEL